MSERAPLVSVVVKSFDYAAFVGQAIQSVLDQSLQDFEVLVTDDGSTDGSAEVLRGFGDARIHLDIAAQNRGISLTMNATLARASGMFVSIANSDDFALPGRLAAQVAFLQANPGVGATFTVPLVVDEAGVPTDGFFDFRQPLAMPDVSQAAWLRRFFLYGNCLCAPTAMVRRSLYQELGVYDPRLNNLQDLDLDMWVRVASAHGIHVMAEKLSAFRVLNGGRNESAPGIGTHLRSQFEMAKILHRYVTMPEDLLRQAFAADCAQAGIANDGPPSRWLAELALVQGSTAHRMFAVETLYAIV